MKVPPPLRAGGIHEFRRQVPDDIGIERQQDGAREQPQEGDRRHPQHPGPEHKEPAEHRRRQREAGAEALPRSAAGQKRAQDIAEAERDGDGKEAQAKP